MMYPRKCRYCVKISDIDIILVHPNNCTICHPEITPKTRNLNSIYSKRSYIKNKDKILAKQYFYRNKGLKAAQVTEEMIQARIAELNKFRANKKGKKINRRSKCKPRKLSPVNLNYYPHTQRQREAFAALPPEEQERYKEIYRSYWRKYERDRRQRKKEKDAENQIEMEPIKDEFKDSYKQLDELNDLLRQFRRAAKNIPSL